MTYLITGANGSGKSAFAEKLAVSQAESGALCYVATMVPYGAEGLARVEKHRVQRADLGFVTYEQPFSVADLDVPPDAVLLLEDVSNLLSNVVFEFGHCESRVFEDIATLCEKCRVCILVSIAGLTESLDYDAETNGYIVALNRLNARLYDYADAAAEMRNGAPFWTKGAAYAVD